MLASEPEVKPCSSATLWSQTAWLRLEIVGGRIAVSSARCGTHRLAAEPPGDKVRESLAIQVEAGTLTARYEQLRAGGELTLAVDERTHLTIGRRSPDDGSAAEMQYQQGSSGQVTLLVGSGQPQRYSAASLWHLLLIHPEPAREHLLPVLGQLRPNWQIAEQLADAEQALVARSGEEVLPQRREWRSWVDALADESFARRQEADRALRRGGQSVLGFLRQLEPGELDAEQRRRIAGIVARAPQESDSPARVAEWLLADKRVWLGLLNRGDLAQRVAAAEHLSRLCGHAVAFDPRASDDLRRVQLAELRAKLAEN
jgi:hypothetical protein